MQEAEPAAGVLYLVGTPIGNLGDLTPRARQVLAGVSLIACEDTRRSGLLLHQLGLRQGEKVARLVSFHQHNQNSRIPELLAALAAGQAVAVVSDAGLPGISDPGEALVAAARHHGHGVICVPGPSAVTTALVSSGLPTERFCFEGFLPAKASQRRARLAELADEPRTVVLFEAPHRLLELLEDLLQNYDGTVFLVSHDRTFLDNVVTSTLAFEGDARWREFEGGVQDWLIQSKRSNAIAQAKGQKGAQAFHYERSEAVKAQPATSPTPAAPAAKTRKLSYKEQRELEALPAQIAALEAEQAAIHAELADGSLYARDNALALQRTQRAADIDAELMAALERWEALGG